jgi:AAA+ superfamily predicted ATPase
MISSRLLGGYDRSCIRRQVHPERELAVSESQALRDADRSGQGPAAPTSKWQSMWLGAAPGLATLRPALRRLDALLERLVAAQQAASVPLRGMYVSPEEAARLLLREPLAPTLGVGTDSGPLLADSALGAIAQRYGLSDFDFDVILIALAPEFDLRYERLYGFLHDDITRRRATVDLALNLRCASVEEKVARLARFAPDAPLIRHAVLHLVADPSHVQPPLLAHFLKVDDQIIGAALGRKSLDARLAAFCRFHDPAPGLDALDVAAEMQPPLRALASAVRHNNLPPALYFHGPRGAGRLAAARAFAAEIGARLLHADLARIADDRDADTTLAILFREALLHAAVLYLDGIDAFRRDDKAPASQSLAAALNAPHGIVILASELDVPPASIALIDLADLAFVPPDFARRRRCWQETLADASIATAPAELDALASRFRLTTAQIRQAAARARNRAVWRLVAQPGAASAAEPTLAELFAAARDQSGDELGRLSRKIVPKQTWRDIVLPPDQETQLREICDQAKLRHRVYGDWGFDRKHSVGKGLNVLFAGPPGTGKTMAAEVIAGEIGIDLCKIDLSRVVSKYIGETEKNLERIFTAAESANAILFFDEADALFGKRSEVRDAHDRYANIEVGYLLQKMDEYDGIAILATNRRQNLDEAFIRRLHAIVEFPFPDEAHRRRIWKVTFPSEAPLAAELDFAVLAREIRLSGGHIRNIAVLAAVYAAAEERAIGLADIARAAWREHQKLGRSWDEKKMLASLPVALSGS